MWPSGMAPGLWGGRCGEGFSTPASSSGVLSPQKNLHFVYSHRFNLQCWIAIFCVIIRMWEIFLLWRVSGREGKNVGVPREMRKTWQVCDDASCPCIMACIVLCNMAALTYLLCIKIIYKYMYFRCLFWHI